jgi:hypothetical protein
MPASGLITGRAEATNAVQQHLAETWVWEGKPAAQWATDLAALHANEAQLRGLEADLNQARTSTDAASAELHEMNVQALAMLRAKYRRDPDTVGLLKGLDAVGDSRREILSDCADLETVWGRLPENAATLTPTLSRSSFAAIRAAALAKVESLEGFLADVRKVRKEYNDLLAELWEDCVDFYAAACARFPEETPEGRMIRGIPTTPVAPGVATPEPAAAPKEG